VWPRYLLVYDSGRSEPVGTPLCLLKTCVMSCICNQSIVVFISIVSSSLAKTMHTQALCDRATPRLTVLCLSAYLPPINHVHYRHLIDLNHVPKSSTLCRVANGISSTNSHNTIHKMLELGGIILHRLHWMLCPLIAPHCQDIARRGIMKDR
jgi:hypothetical protein